MTEKSVPNCHFDLDSRHPPPLLLRSGHLYIKYVQYVEMKHKSMSWECSDF